MKVRVSALCVSPCLLLLLDMIATGASWSNSHVLLRGVLVAADTKKPIGNADVYATSKTRPPRSIKVTTAPNGTFELSLESGLPYAVCSDSAGIYINTCVFSKPVTVGPNNNGLPILLTAPAGIRRRVQIHDPGKRVRMSRVPHLSADPLDLLVYVEESSTRTRVPVPINGEMQDGLEYLAVIPANPAWRLSVNSARWQLLQPAGQPSAANSTVPASAANASGELVSVFSVSSK